MREEAGVDNPLMKVVLFSEDQENITSFEAIVSRHTEIQILLGVSSTHALNEEIFLHESPNLIVVDFASLPFSQQEPLLIKLERISETIPFVGIFNLSQKEHAFTYAKRGVRDFIELPFQEQELIKILRRFQGKTLHPPQKRGRVYSFFSLKGGVGNTFVTVNAAVSLARLTKTRVLLWDMALQAGDIPFFLNAKMKHALLDILQHPDQADENYWQGIFSPHASGVSILPAPEKIEDLEKLTPELIEKGLHLFRHHFDHIFIDAGYRLTEPLIPLLDASLYIFVTATLELISLRSASRCLDLLDRMNYPPEKIKIIINRHHSKCESVPVEKAKKILKYDLVHFISNDYPVVSQSVNLGQVIADTARGSVLDKQFREFAARIASNFNEKQNHQKIFGRLSGAIKKVISHVSY